MPGSGASRQWFVRPSEDPGTKGQPCETKVAAPAAPAVPRLVFLSHSEDCSSLGLGRLSRPVATSDAFEGGSGVKESLQRRCPLICPLPGID